MRDGLKEGKPDKLLNKVGKIAHHLRKPSVSNILHRSVKKRMVIDMPSTWGTAYTMLRLLHEQKSEIFDMKSQKADSTEQEWNERELNYNSLKFPCQANIKLQQDSVTLG